MLKIIVLLLLFPCFSYSQSVYKCTIDGVTTFSQISCDEQYEEINIDISSGTPASKDSLGMEGQCLNHLMPHFRDPDSVRVNSTKTEWQTDKSGARRVLILNIHAKNEDGGFGKSKSYSCYLSHDGTRLSKIQYLVK